MFICKDVLKSTQLIFNNFIIGITLSYLHCKNLENNLINMFVHIPPTSNYIVFHFQNWQQVELPSVYGNDISECMPHFAQDCSQENPFTNMMSH